MKTTKQTTKRFPDGLRMILYIVAVAALGFVSCAFKTGDPVNVSENAISIETILNTQADPEIRLENWMLNFNEEFLAELEDESIVLEDWMLNFNEEYLTEVEDETIALEYWMLNFNDGFLSEVEDEKVGIEDWMIDPNSFSIPDYLVVEKEEETVLEDWMLDPGYYVVKPLFIAKNDR